VLEKIKMKFYEDWIYWSAVLIAIVFWLIWQSFDDTVFYNGSLSQRQLFSIIFLYPILEEFSFRGMLQGYLLEYRIFNKKILGFSLSNYLTSLLFSCFHLFSKELFFAFLIFFPSLIFGYFRDKYKSVLPSILLHCFYNAGFLYIHY